MTYSDTHLNTSHHLRLACHSLFTCGPCLTTYLSYLSILVTSVLSEAPPSYLCSPQHYIPSPATHLITHHTSPALCTSHLTSSINLMAPPFPSLLLLVPPSLFSVCHFLSSTYFDLSPPLATSRLYCLKNLIIQRPHNLFIMLKVSGECPSYLPFFSPPYFVFHSHTLFLNMPFVRSS